MSSAVKMVKAKCGCGDRGNVRQGGCSSCAAPDLGGSEEKGGQKGLLYRAERRLGTQQHLSEAVYVDLKGKEDAGNECTFCCRCWTDE
ncbi:hypothetical protein SAMN04487896_3511 [Paenibacillus sp. ov031]|nr:hypothetical protein SAMN04487896_3511 [Paenibacillus sp. ov031]